MWTKRDRFSKVLKIDLKLGQIHHFLKNLFMYVNVCKSDIERYYRQETLSGIEYLDIVEYKNVDRERLLVLSFCVYFGPLSEESPTWRFVWAIHGQPKMPAIVLTKGEFFLYA